MKKILNIMFYATPMIIIFTIVLLTFWPGVIVSDSMVQWNQVQTGNYSDWHPVYNTLYIALLSKICNNPTFVIFVQLILLSLCMAFVMTRIEKYYKVNKIYLFVFSILFALIPLNFNFAITLLKDILYSAFVLLLTGLIIDILNDTSFFKNWKKCLLLTITFLVIVLFRHNGIIVSLLSSFVLIIKYKKEKAIYIIVACWLIIYLLLTTVGYKILKVSKDSYINKYGPISHIMARLLNTDGVYFSDEEMNTLSEFVDVEKLKDTFDPHNMDHSINAQNIDNIRENSNKYVKFAFRKFLQYPKEVITHYITLTSFLYSPIPFKDSYAVGMFIRTDLWEYKDMYPNIKIEPKIRALLLPLLEIEINYGYGKFADYTLRPALYMYLSIIFICIICHIKKTKSLFLILLPSLFNTLSLFPAMPIGMTRYVYSTMLVFYFVLPWFIYEIFTKIKERKK